MVIVLLSVTPFFSTAICISSCVAKDNSFWSVKFFTWVNFAFQIGEGFHFCRFSVCFLLSTSTSRLVLLIVFIILGFALHENIFSVKKRKGFTKKVSSSDSIRVNLGNSVIFFIFWIGFTEVSFEFFWVFTIWFVFLFFLSACPVL